MIKITSNHSELCYACHVSLKEIINNPDLVGPRWHQSREKREFDALIAEPLRTIIRPISLLTAHTLHTAHGYELFYSMRDSGKQTDSGKPDLVPILKVQTMHAKDIIWEPGIQDRTPLLPLAWLARYLMLDQLVELEHVSSDPDSPGPLSLTGPRYLIHEERTHMKATAQQHGESDLYDAWDDCYVEMPKGVADISSDIPGHYAQGTMPFYRERMKRHIWWSEHASPKLDLAIIHGMVELGITRIATIDEAVEPQIRLWQKCLSKLPTS